MISPHHEKLKISPKRNTRKPRNKKKGVLTMYKPENEVIDHMPLSRVIKASSHKGVDNEAFTSCTRKGQKNRILLSKKLQESFNSERKRVYNYPVQNLYPRRKWTSNYLEWPRHKVLLASYLHGYLFPSCQFAHSKMTFDYVAIFVLIAAAFESPHHRKNYALNCHLSLTM
uniref:Uncharacterized protein n=1 Tax=Glossina austeni TaxID=7395 RepID=A0A1A9UDB9_GLOAU